MNKLEIIDSLIKDAENEYLEKNIIIYIPQLISKSFRAYCSMQGEIEDILSFIEIYQNIKNSYITASLTFSIITMYGKLFTDASKGKNPKLEAAQVFKDNPDLITIHNSLMKIRHNYIAHRSSSNKDISIAYMMMPKHEYNEERIPVEFRQYKMVCFSSNEISDIKTICKFLNKYLSNTIEKSGQKMRDSFLENYKEKFNVFYSFKAI